MTKQTIYKSVKGKAKIRSHYDSYLPSIEFQGDSKYVQTSFGMTHVLIAGPKDGKPIFIFQGGNCINPMSLAWFLPLANQYRIYAPDTLGHPGYSDETRMSPKDDSFARWIEELMDFFGVSESAFIGPSYGAGIILRLATYLPEKIVCAALISPAGIALGSIREMVKEILWPLLLFKTTKSDVHLRKITGSMSEQQMSTIDQEIIHDIFKYLSLETEMPKLINQKELKNYHAPTLIIAGEKDVFFPSRKLLKPAVNNIPNLVLFKTYKTGHFPPREFLPYIQQDITTFLEKYY